jgi:dipeptidyl aminopeptidase/acylaminoacyl peptidase
MRPGSSARSVAPMLRSAPLAAIAATGALAAPAAADPPVNGRIAYTTFESNPGQAFGDIWTMNADGSDKQQIVFDPKYDAQSDWSPDGTKIAYRAMRGTRFQVAIADLTVLDPVTHRPRITDIPPAPDGSQSSQPSWFPDGKQLLYRRTTVPASLSATGSDLYAMNADGTNRHLLLAMRDEQWYPILSPDAKTLVFADTNYRVDGREVGRAIDEMDMASGVVRTLYDSPDPAVWDSGPAWSPDGKQIAFESNLDGDLDVYVMNADGTNVRQLTHNSDLHDEGPAWSPDGMQIVYASGPDDLHEDIYVMNADGSGQPRQLTTYPGRDESPDWGVAPHPLGVGGTVPATLSVTLADPVQLGAFVPGVAKTYTAATTATVTSTAGNAALTASATGPLANGAYTLAQPLQITGLPHTWNGPVSNDAVPVGFAQAIGASEPLRTGTYATTVVFSLSTTAP